jgi:hypothetical protein
MTLAEFLTWAATTAGGGVVVFGLIEFVNKLIEPRQLPPDVKFYGAMLLAFLVPLAAYIAEIALGIATWGLDGLFLSIATGYMISQAVHRTTEAGRPVA